MTPAERLALRLLRAPRNSWARLRFKGGDDFQLETCALAIAQRAVYLAGYLSARGSAGYGDHGHDKALVHAEKQLKRVRKALGYTFP